MARITSYGCYFYSLYLFFWTNIKRKIHKVKKVNVNNNGRSTLFYFVYIFLMEYKKKAPQFNYFGVIVGIYNYVVRMFINLLIIIQSDVGVSSIPMYLFIRCGYFDNIIHILYYMYIFLFLSYWIDQTKKKRIPREKQRDRHFVFAWFQTLNTSILSAKTFSIYGYNGVGDTSRLIKWKKHTKSEIKLMKNSWHGTSNKH